MSFPHDQFYIDQAHQETIKPLGIACCHLTPGSGNVSMFPVR